MEKSKSKIGKNLFLSILRRPSFVTCISLAWFAQFQDINCFLVNFFLASFSISLSDNLCKSLTFVLIHIDFCFSGQIS